MTLATKDWRDRPDHSTPMSAAALEDLETRMGAYVDAALTSLTRLAGLHWQGIWASGTTYAQGDGVDRSGKQYVSNIASNTGNDPATHNTGDGSGTQWSPMTAAGLEYQANKDQPSGYAGLSAGSKLTGTQVPDAFVQDHAASPVDMDSTGVTNGQILAYDGTAGEFKPTAPPATQLVGSHGARPTAADHPAVIYWETDTHQAFLSDGAAWQPLRPGDTVSDTNGLNAPLSDVAGNRLVNIPAWQPSTVYPAGYVVQHSGLLYQANSAFTSGGSFNGANWTALTASGIRLQSATRTTNFTGSGTAVQDVTGLSITFTAPSAPVMLEAWCFSVQQTGSNGAPTFYITDSANTQLTLAYGTVVTASQFTPSLICKVELTGLTAGTSYTYKVRIGTTAGSFVLFAGGTFPAYLRAVQQ